MKLQIVWQDGQNQTIEFSESAAKHLYENMKSSQLIKTLFVANELKNLFWYLDLSTAREFWLEE